MIPRGQRRDPGAILRACAEEEVEEEVEEEEGEEKEGEEKAVAPL